MKEIFISLLEACGLAYWLEISTDQPQCTYYFGPFLTKEEAIASQDGYIEDLTEEGAVNIQVRMKRCKEPSELTIFDEKNSKTFSLSAFSFSS